MPEYQYQGVDKGGKRVKGNVTATSEGDLRMILRAQGIRPVRIGKTSALNLDLSTIFRRFVSGQAGSGGPGLAHVSLVIFTRQLQVLLSSGVPVVQGLQILGEQATDANLRNIVLSLREKVSAGAYLWEAMAGYPNAFPRIYISLIRAGESSGSIDQMMRRLSRYLEDAERLRKMVKSAMMYPTIVVSIGVGVIGVMLIFVIPKFEELLTSAGQELPGPTRFVIDSSHFLVNNIGALTLGTGATIFMVVRYVKSTEGRAMLDRLLFRAPIFGELMQKSSTARFCRTMQTLLNSGVNLIDAIDICRATVNNAVMEEAIAKIRGEIEGGKTLGRVVMDLPVFPKMAAQMIGVGESTGNLDKMLEKVADFYEEDVEGLVGGLTKLLEPLILVFLGGAVGGLLIAMYLPIFKLAGGAEGG